MAANIYIAGLFFFSIWITLASPSQAAIVDLCDIDEISFENFTLWLNISDENAMKHSGGCSRVILLKSSRVKLVVEELNIAGGSVFEIHDGPGPNKGQIIGPKADTQLPSSYVSSDNALFIMFKNGQGDKGSSTFRGKITAEPYQHTCHCRGVTNGLLECSESNRERRCKVKCQPLHMDLSINQDVTCDLVKGEWDMDIHDMPLACQKVQSPSQINATVHFNYANLTCRDVDREKVRSGFGGFIEKNSDIQDKGVCFSPSGSCDGRLKVNCTDSNSTKITVTITDRIAEPPTLKEANSKLQELLTAYENLKLVDVLDSNELIVKKDNKSFTADKGSFTRKISPLCSEQYDYIKVPGNGTSFVCSTCPMHHAYNATTHVCQKCPTGSFAAERATSCTEKNGTATMIPVKSSCSNACMKGKRVYAKSWMCEWCPLDTFQNSSTNLNPKCIPCPDQKKTIFPGAQSVAECLDPCSSGTFWNTSSNACQNCPIGFYMDVDKHVFTKCKVCDMGKTTGAAGSKESNDCYKCTPGQFYNSQSKMCSPCAEGKYQDEINKSTCRDCPDGKTTLATGSNSLSACVTPCVSGQFLNASTKMCSPCPEGKYQDEINKSTCKDCPDGKTTVATGSNSLSACVTPCRSGQFLNASTGKCDDCPMDTYQDLTQHHSNECKQCGLNKVTHATGQSNVSQCFDSCSKGWFLEKSASQCKKCPKGQYQDQSGQDQCKQCPDGKSTISEGQSDNSSCLATCGKGEFFDTSTNICHPCPYGRYQEVSNHFNVNCEICPSKKTTVQEGGDDAKTCIAIAKEDKFEKIQVSLRFVSLSWTEELKDKNSAKYQETKGFIEDEIKFEFRYDPSFEAVEVTNLRNGSVIAEFDLQFNDKADYEPIKVLQDAVRNGKVGNLTVSPESFRILHQGCAQPLGMENGQIKDDQITASSHFKKYEPYEGRLNAKGGLGWHAMYTTSKEYLQIDFRGQVNITAVATQGVGQSTEPNYVTEYKLNMSDDGITWNEYKENEKAKVQISIPILVLHRIHSYYGHSAVNHEQNFSAG